MNLDTFATMKKPNIPVPEGMELAWNGKMWAFRPILGYSTVYLTKRTFVPKSNEERRTENEGKETPETKNGNLYKARRDKNDEFYTRLEDIANELKHYKKFFEGKVVYCPCDKAFNLGRSNFFQFFQSHFLDWGLKKLVATQYVEGGRGWMWVIEKGDINGNGYIDESEIDTYQLDGNGDFLSTECRKIMSECDIVVTNPPFSLFRPFAAQLEELGKQYLIIGNQNAITYKEIFPLIKENKMWLGYTSNKTLAFESPYENTENNNKEAIERMGLDPKKYILVKGISWFTNLPHDKRKEDLYLGGTYTNHESSYPRYDNYDAIEVGKVVNIPNDYYGVMGVPITFLDKYNPTQFEIVGMAAGNSAVNGFGESANYRKNKYDRGGCGVINDNRVYARILIRRKTN